MIFTIADCSVNTDAYEVRHKGRVVPVEPQVFDLLVQLLESPGRVVTKDEIIQRIWNGRLVSDAALSSRIKSLRKAIGDDGNSQSIVRTIRGRGFRVVADVSRSSGEPDHTRLAIRHPPAAAVFRMPAGPGIAVWRFKKLANDEPAEFLCDALRDEIITELTRYSEVRVISRASMADYDLDGIEISELGRELGVEFLLQGNLARSADRLRVTAQLLRVTDGMVLWGDRYERELIPAEIFSVQDDIASKVVVAIASITAGVIARDRLGQTRGKPPRDLSAYESVIRANEVMASGFSAESHLSTRRCLEAALASEPDYAAAWAMLAWLHTLEYSYGYNRQSGSDPRERALFAAQRAVDLAPANPMSRFAMARAAYLMRDLDVFYAEAVQALRLNPHEPLLLGNLGNWLAFTGRWEDGVAMVRKAIALNPKAYPRWWHAAVGKNHYRNGEFEKALTEFRLMNLPNWWWNQVELAYTYGQLGDRKNSIKAVSKLLELYPGFDLHTAVAEHRKFSFEESYIKMAVDGLRKAGVPEKTSRKEV